MDKVGLLILSIILSGGLVDATFGRGVLYPFPINSLLECHIPDPFDPKKTTPGPIPRIPFGIPQNVNTDPVSQIWLPQETR